MNTLDTSKPVMVSGATGYVAGRLVEKLLQEGFTVHAAVRDPENKEKLKFLNSMSQGLPGELRFFKSDLLQEGSYDEAMNGCQLVFHTASPFTRNVNDAQKDLIDPAKKGTRNVLESANRIKTVERVVLTSSCAAIYGDARDTLDMPNQELSEEIWNTTSSLTHQPYSYSKTVAEQEAWDVANSQDRWDLVVINPSFVVGPAINPNATSESFTVVKQMGNGDFKMGAPEFNIGFIDVRDLAEAHYQAGIRPEALGRHIISAENLSFIKAAAYIKEAYPKAPIKLRKLPKWLLWLIAPTIGMKRKEVSYNIGYPWKANNSKSRKELGMNYRPIKESIVEMFEQLIEVGEIQL